MEVVCREQRPRKPAPTPSKIAVTSSSCPKNTVNELIREHLGIEDRGPIQFVTKENALQAVESIDFRPAGRPIENEKGSVGWKPCPREFSAPQR